VDDRLFGGVVGLLAVSPVHRDWTVSDIERLIVPPMRLGQFVVLRKRDHIFAYGSWALFGDMAEDGYVTGRRKIQPEDWRSGDRLWAVDVIAPHGDVREIVAMMRADLLRRGYQGRTIRFRRVKATSRRLTRLTV